MTPARQRALIIGAWLVATALLVLLFRTVDSARLMSFVERADGRWLVLAVLSNLSIQPFGAMQWHSLLPAAASIARKRMLMLYSLTSVANNTTPSIVGHVTGVMLIANEPGVGKAAALSVLALDQMAVGLIKVCILLVASLVLPLPEWMHRGLLGLAAVVTTLAIAAVIVSRRTTYLDVLRDPRRVAAGVAFATAIKLAEVGSITAVQLAFGLTVSAQSILIVLAATALASVVPVAPANIGTFEAAAYAAYRFLGLAPEAALGIAVVQHVCQLLPAVGAGYIVLAVRAVTGLKPGPKPEPNPTVENH